MLIVRTVIMNRKYFPHLIVEPKKADGLLDDGVPSRAQNTPHFVHGARNFQMVQKRHAKHDVNGCGWKSGFVSRTDMERCRRNLVHIHSSGGKLYEVGREIDTDHSRTAGYEGRNR